jgi:hypothetical protein
MRRVALLGAMLGEGKATFSNFSPCRYRFSRAANVPIGTNDVEGHATSVHGIGQHAKLTTPPPAPAAPAGATGHPLPVKEVYQTPPREVLRQITPVMSPATISKNELNDAALTLKFLSEGWNSVDGKGTGNAYKRPRSERRASTGMEPRELERPYEMRAKNVTTSMTPTGDWSGGYDHTPNAYNSGEFQYSGKSKRAASRKCAALLKEALFEECQHLQPQRSQSARGALSASSVVPGTLLKTGKAGSHLDPAFGFGGYGSATTAAGPVSGSKAKAQVPKVTMAKAGKKKVSASSGEGRKRSRNYSENSRVGRAVQNIYKYIIQHQSTYLANGAKGVPERVIREEYGNNPDTSKALRYLVAENRINKEGAGGRRDPFSYTIKSMPSPAHGAEYDPKDKKTSLLRSLGVPPPELCLSPLTPIDRTQSSEPSGSKPYSSTRQPKRTKSDVHLVDPPPGPHHPTLEEPSAGTNMLSPCRDEEKACLESRQTKFQPRLSFGESGDAKASALALPSLPSLPMLSPFTKGNHGKILESTVIDPAKAADLQTSFASADPQMQAAMVMRVQAALLNQTIAMMSRISSRQPSDAEVAPDPNNEI